MRNKRRFRGALLVAFGTMVPVGLWGWTMAQCSKFGTRAEVRECMSSGEGAVEAKVLTKDSQVITRTYSAVQKFYGERSAGDVERVVGLAWLEFRSEVRFAAMKDDEFVRKAQNFGELAVVSVPKEAWIDVDGKRWDSWTNTKDWTAAGRRLVKLTKDKCEPEEGWVDVPSGGKVEFKRTLRCKT